MNTGDVVTVALPVYAEYTVRVELTEEMARAVNENDDWDEVMDAAYDQLPSGLCHGCTTGNSGVGWLDESPVYLEMGESPEVHYIMDSRGNDVYGDHDKKLGW